MSSRGPSMGLWSLQKKADAQEGEKQLADLVDTVKDAVGKTFGLTKKDDKDSNDKKKEKRQREKERRKLTKKVKRKLLGKN